MKLCLLALCAAATLCAQTSARITGRITTGKALVRGEITAVATEGSVRLRTFPTDAQGQFTIDIGPGPVLLVAKADGYVSEERELVVRPGNGNPALHFALSPAGSLSGHVYDGNGVPVTGARVWVDYKGEARRWRTAEEAGGEATDVVGFFKVPVVAQDRPFVLHAECEGWLMSTSGTIKLRGPEMSGVMLLLSRRGANVQGRVVDAAGNALGGAEVRLRSLAAKDEFTPEQRASLAFARSTNKSTITGADGSYSFAGVPAGEVVVTARAGNRRASGQAATAAGRATEILLTLR